MQNTETNRRTYAYLYAIGRDNPFEIDREEYDAIIEAIQSESCKFLILKDGSIIMKSSIATVELEPRNKSSAEKYQRWGLPSIKENPLAELPEFIEKEPTPEEKAERLAFCETFRDKALGGRK